MTRVKRGNIAIKRRRKTLKYTKGFLLRRHTKERAAKEALLHAWSYAFRDRRKKKGVARAKWNIQINAASRMQGLSYSKLINQLKKNNIKLDRKILAELANKEPKVFEKILESVK
ncbi:MAG: 50S ribosomal protein L20 [Parcubacteria group bacterium GW2011_GWA2_39_18]|nr:MAG: 50S ribosomal protein L20 [Parcubacteria group bacterium GW2011_GWA2_39_18]